MTLTTSPSTILAKWTVDDYHKMIAAGILRDRPVELLSDRPVELLNGAIVERSPVGKPHAHLSSDAADYLRDKLRGQAKIREGKPIPLPNASEPEPDIAIVQALGDVYLDHHPYVDNIFWVIEYSDASLEKDLNIRTQTYAQAGILKYWVINLRTMELIVYRQPGEGTYLAYQTLTSGTVVPVSFPDITIVVNRLLRR